MAKTASKKTAKKTSKAAAKKPSSRRSAAEGASKPKAAAGKKSSGKKKSKKAAAQPKQAKAQPKQAKAKSAAKPAKPSKAAANGSTVQTVRAAPGKSAAAGKQLVIVESPAKAKTINKYLGDDFVVRASVGHIRDLPSRSPKGAKQPVPGVDLENDFQPTYEILSQKTKTVAELKRDAKAAKDIWFATDLDREGEAIAWHLATVLDVDPTEA
jgi:DNA topoisomerase-1